MSRSSHVLDSSFNSLDVNRIAHGIPWRIHGRVLIEERPPLISAKLPIAAISNHRLPRSTMKGSLLLTIRHDSSRFTRDLDFSTTEQYRADMADQLLDEFEK
mgnify:FL=1